MNVYIKLSNQQYPCQEHEVRQSVYPRALGTTLTNSDLESLGYALVNAVAPPSNVALGYYITEGQPEKVGDYYYQTWVVNEYDLATKKIIKLQHYNVMFNSMISLVKTDYPSTEVESWAKQEAEARELLSNPEAQASLVRTIASSRGVDVTWLAGKIVEKADAYAAYVGNLIGTRQFIEHQIANATEETIDSITWPPVEE